MYLFMKSSIEDQYKSGFAQAFLACGELGKAFDIYLSERFPKIAIDKIENNSPIYMASIILIICGLFISMISII